MAFDNFVITDLGQPQFARRWWFTFHNEFCLQTMKDDENPADAGRRP